MKGSVIMIRSNVTRALAVTIPSTLGLARHRIGILIVLVAIPPAVTRSQVNEKPPQPAFADNTPVIPHESLTKVALPNTTIDSVELNAADGSCRVRATVTHPPMGCRVKVFVALPPKGWNGRFQGTGGGGFLGGHPAALNGPVRSGYATAATDTGHEGGSGKFALGADGRLNWHAVQDNAYLGIHEMKVVGKALTKAYYGKAPRYSYFVGGSTGGRQGLMEAQREKQSVEEFGAVIGTDDPDLTQFRDRGGKIIIAHGLTDQLIPADGTIDYYQRILQRMGGREAVGRFARLFLAPGVDHGFRGPGATPVGQMEAIVRWVEHGTPPDMLTAERRDGSGKVIRTRPLFPYPQVAKYKGNGSTDDAENFVSSLRAD
jgi:hypothetical protein